MSRAKKGEIKAVIFGENFSIFEPKALELKNKYVELSKYINKGNHGITVVEL